MYLVAVRVFANGLGDLGSIPGRVIPKTQKMVLDASLLNTQHYKVRIKGKVEQSREGVAPSPTSCCSSYRKGSLQVTLDYGRQLYLLLYIYIYLCVCVCVWYNVKVSGKYLWIAMKVSPVLKMFQPNVLCARHLVINIICDLCKRGKELYSWQLK